MSEYEGWKNRETWNIMLHINNDFPTYKKAVAFMKNYSGDSPYKDFVKKEGFENKKTVDDVSFSDSSLDISELDSGMKELAPENSHWFYK